MRSRRNIVVLILALALITPGAWAADIRPQGVSASADLLQQAWSWLTGLWVVTGDEGCSADPLGCPRPRTDEGWGTDPLGSQAPNADVGCKMDPLGCTYPSTDVGPDMDPLG